MQLPHFAVGYCVNPISRALPIELTGNQNTDTLIHLAANVPIPDNGELNWPIHVTSLHGPNVADVAVELHGLWHEHVSDLRCVVFALRCWIVRCADPAACRVTLTHGFQSAVLFSGVAGARTALCLLFLV